MQASVHRNGSDDIYFKPIRDLIVVVVDVDERRVLSS